MGCPIIVRLPDPIWLLISTFDTHLALASNKQEERKGQVTDFTQTDFKKIMSSFYSILGQILITSIPTYFMFHKKAFYATSLS